jgi:hypothetical protein
LQRPFQRYPPQDFIHHPTMMARSGLKLFGIIIFSTHPCRRRRGPQ